MSRNTGNNESNEFDETSPKIEIRANELEKMDQQSGDFDEFGEFGKNNEFDEISPKIRIRANELEGRVPTKRRF